MSAPAERGAAARPLVRLRPGEGRRVRSGAPWAFSNEIVIDAAAKSLPPGAIVHLADDRGGVLGTGYFNRNSLIAVRLLAPPDAALDGAFFAGRLGRALQLRHRFYCAPYYRLAHAEGDFLPGLVIDRFGQTCVVHVTTAGMEALMGEVLHALDATVAPANVILRNDAPARALEGLPSYVRAAKGEAPDRILLEENGIRYVADPKAGQKSGWYYDQRDNRAFIARIAKGARVLDAFCYSGGFGVLAATSGASHITGIDSSEAALGLAADAARANGVAERCRFLKSDVFAALERLAEEGERFDIVVCDPPPFAPARKDIEAGARAYRKLARLAARLVEPRGFLMLASCSHNMSRERFAAECAAGIARAGREAALIREAGAGPDHPVHPLVPETAYLKALFYAVGR